MIYTSYPDLDITQTPDSTDVVKARRKDDRKSHS